MGNKNNNIETPKYNAQDPERKADIDGIIHEQFDKLLQPRIKLSNFGQPDSLKHIEDMNYVHAHSKEIIAAKREHLSSLPKAKIDKMIADFKTRIATGENWKDRVSAQGNNGRFLSK